jgi:hypothetical protein
VAVGALVVDAGGPDSVLLRPEVELVEELVSPSPLDVDQVGDNVNVVWGASTTVIVTWRMPSMITAFAELAKAAWPEAVSCRVARPLNVTSAFSAVQLRLPELNLARISLAANGTEKLACASWRSRGMASPMVKLSLLPALASAIVVHPVVATVVQSGPVKPPEQRQEHFPLMIVLLPPLAHATCCWHC